MDSLSRLQAWYAGQCNGLWEHGYGVRIGTLDNPGWTLKVDLSETSAEARALAPRTIERTENDWIHYRVENRQFQAFMGPRNLNEGIDAFLAWFEEDSV